MSEILEPMEEIMVDEELPTRLHPFCVISKEGNENGWHDLQDNSGWGTNPDPEYFAVLPDNLYESIWETGGYCDITLNKDGTEVVSFVALDKPDIPEPTPEATQLDMIEAQVTYTALMTDTLLEG